MPSPSLRSPADFTYTIGLSNGDMRQVPYDGINTALLRADQHLVARDARARDGRAGIVEGARERPVVEPPADERAAHAARE